MEKHFAQSLVDVNASDQTFKERESNENELLKNCEKLEGPFPSSFS